MWAIIRELVPLLPYPEPFQGPELKLGPFLGQREAKAESDILLSPVIKLRPPCDRLPRHKGDFRVSSCGHCPLRLGCRSETQRIA